MAWTLRSVYDQTCDALCEPNGLVLGLVTDTDFLNYAKDALADFLQKTGIYRKVFYLKGLAFIGQYTYSDVLAKTLALFYDRQGLRKTSAFSLDMEKQSWQQDIDHPQEWHEDRLAPKTLEITPAPTYSGDDIPDAPVPESAGDGNLLLIGEARQDLSALTLDTTVEGIPDSFMLYIKWRVLWKVFSSNAEMKDPRRARYCAQRYDEGVALAKAVMGQEEFD